MTTSQPHCRPETFCTCHKIASKKSIVGNHPQRPFQRLAAAVFVPRRFMARRERNIYKENRRLCTS
jgi:hypothetical protein